MATWRNISRISSRVTPLVSAALMCVRNSLGRLRTEIMAKLSMLRDLRGRPSRPQTAPQQYSVMRSCSGLVKSSALANAWLTYASPSTAERISSPRWYVLRSNGLLLCDGAFSPGSASTRVYSQSEQLAAIALERYRFRTRSCYDLGIAVAPHRMKEGGAVVTG